MCVYRKGKKILQLTDFSIKNFLVSGTMVIVAGDTLRAGGCKNNDHASYTQQ